MLVGGPGGLARHAESALSAGYSSPDFEVFATGYMLEATRSLTGLIGDVEQGCSRGAPCLIEICRFWRSQSDTTQPSRLNSQVAGSWR